MKYNEVIEYIDNRPQFTKLTGLERCEKLLKAMGNPELNMKIIHVAGTNGKGSVCAYLTSILIKAGCRVGTFTSPHLERINERIMIDNQPVSDEMLTQAFNYVYPVERKIAAETGVEATYFDYLFACAMYIYKDNVDYVIMETGLGGKLDGTNAVKNPLVSCITSIGLDHCAILGNTIEQIAREKAGIIKPGVPVCYYASDAEIGNIMQEQSSRCQSMSIAVDDNSYEIIKNSGKHIDFLLHSGYYKECVFSIDTVALYQVINASLAINVAGVINQYTNTYISAECIREGLMMTHWKGRMELLENNVYIDGAHNVPGVEAFVKTAKIVAERYKDKKKVLMFSAVKDKDYINMIRILCDSNIFDEYVVTQLGGNRNLETKSIEKQFEQCLGRTVLCYDNVESGYDAAIEQKGKDGLLMCAGSLYLIGQIRSLRRE